MTSLVPYLTFRDGEASLRFLTDVLGFEVSRSSAARTGPSSTPSSGATMRS